MLKEALIMLGASAISGAMSSEPTSKPKEGKSVGFIDAFLMSSGAMKPGDDVKQVTPFTAPEGVRPRSVAELTRGQPTTRAVRTDPIQRLVQSDPRVSNAVSQMLTQSSNQQMRDFSSKYATRATTPQGRKTLVSKQPGDIKVGA